VGGVAVRGIAKMRRGEVYDASLEMTEGSEQGGTRPVIIVSRDVINLSSPVVLAVPCKCQYQTMEIPKKK
jgi:mRNA interferase MazF